MPKTTQYPAEADFFLPFWPTDAQRANRASHDYLVIGRLRPGVTLGQAAADLNVIAERDARAYPATNTGREVKVEALLADNNGDLTALYFNLIQGATFFVLMVVCANIANLEFARGIQRRPEIAMRTALGAGRGRLLRQLLTENLLLGLMGGLGGLLIAACYMHINQAAMPEPIARHLAGWSNISLNGRALGLSLALAVLSGIVSGFAPALAALRINLVDQLKSGSRSVVGSGRSSRLSNMLAAAQIAMAVALVVGAALMSKGMLAMLHLADPYHPNQTLTFLVHLPAARYDTDERQAAWFKESLGRLRALPGVQTAEVTSAMPYSDDAWLDNAHIENRPLAPGQAQTALRLAVSSSYFRAFGIPIVSGHLFSSSDEGHTRPAAVVSQAFATRYFPGEEAVGKRIRMGDPGPSQTPWLTIVGVVGEATYSLWDRARPPAVYMNVAELPTPAVNYAITTEGDPLALAPALRKALAAMDPGLPLEDVQTYEQFVHEKLTGLFYVAATLGFDALVALLLASIGIFGVMANLVGERTREIGVRMAMGAQREQVLRMILGRAAWLTGMGVSAGLVLALALAHGVANLLYQVSPNDPLVFASIAGTILVVAFLASWIPARRAAHIDPMMALRDQ
jgi:predicted permease